jgi:hypothetical protein
MIIRIRFIFIFTLYFEGLHVTVTDLAKSGRKKKNNSFDNNKNIINVKIN